MQLMIDCPAGSCPEVVPPQQDLCPLWKLVSPPFSLADDGEDKVYYELVAWCDLLETARAKAPDFGPGKYYLASPGGEIVGVVAVHHSLARKEVR